MTRTICLPFEILAAIFEKIDDLQDLRHVRMVCHAWCAAATPFAFRAHSVITTSASARNLGRLFDLPNITVHIREVSYHDTATNEGEWSPKYGKFALSHSPLPRLETINLNFNPVHAKHSNVDFDGQRRTTLQESILRALAASFNVRVPPKLMSLSLHNLRTSDPPTLENFTIQAILATLRRLQLSVLFDAALDSSTIIARWRHFWGTLFPRMPAVPVQTHFTLTELALHSGQYVGDLPGLSVHELHFPRLSVLSLRRIVFAPSFGAEDFTLLHAGTLARLELLNCAVLMDDVELSSSPSWDCIWDRFAAELTALVTLDVDGPRDNRRPRCRTSRDGFHYVRRLFMFPESYLLMPSIESRIAADFAALQRLDMTVASNAQSKERRVAAPDLAADR